MGQATPREMPRFAQCPRRCLFSPPFHHSITPLLHHSMKTLLVAIHGIMTNQTNASWPDKLDAWMFDYAPEIKVIKKEYRAGPFPRWNCRIKDPALARSLANELELFLRGPLSRPVLAAP